MYSGAFTLTGPPFTLKLIATWSFVRMEDNRPVLKN
jgi:hypothetical protein